MTIRVELNPEMERQLAAEALTRGIALELYAQRLLQEAMASRSNGVLARARKNFAPFSMPSRARRPMFPNCGPRPSRVK
jgi:hypothetical protein